MAKRFYIVPKVGDGTGVTPSTHFRPKYIADLPVLWSAMDYGLEPTYLVGAEVTPEQHTALAAETDVIAVPLDLDNTISSGALAQAQAALESMLVPGGWVTTAHTWREVVSFTGKLFKFMGVFRKRQLRRFFESGVTLGTPMSALTQGQRDALEEAALFLGLDVSSIIGTTTVRQALKILGDQMPGFTLFGEAFA